MAQRARIAPGHASQKAAMRRPVHIERREGPTRRS